MSDAPAAATTPEPEPTPESVTFNVKSNNDTRYSITMPLTARVTELKDKLSELADIPSDRQRLIYSGRVMKNDDTLETYKIKSGNTVHMVKGAASNPTPAPATAPAVPRNLASGSGNNPLAGLTGARYAGHVQLPSADIFGPDGGVSPPPPPTHRI